MVALRSAAQSRDRIQAKAVAEFKNAQLLAISPDGQKLALYSTKEHLETFVERSGKFTRIDKNRDKDSLSVVDVRTSGVIYSNRFRNRVSSASFFADSNRLYAEIEGSGQSQRIVVDLKTKTEQSLKPASWDAHTYFDAGTGNTLVGLVLSPAKGSKTRWLTLVELPVDEERARVSFATQEREAKGYDCGEAFSADRSIVAYAFDHTVVSRRTRDLSVVWTRPIDREFLTVACLSVSADGSWVAFAVQEKDGLQAPGRCYIGVADGADGSQLARFPLNGTGGISISPDGKLLAVAVPAEDLLKSGQNAPTVQLYEVATGRQVASLVHDQVPDAHTTIFDGRFTTDGIQFTSDGKHLVTSTIHTRVWAIDS
jgi:WD40 repeat protein